MIILFSWYLFAQFALVVRGKELSAPSSWNIPIVKSSREERINRTTQAIEAFIASDNFFNSTQPPSNLIDTYWPYGAFLATISDFDILTNQTRYKKIAQQRLLPALQKTTPNISQYGYAATRAYLAYRDEAFLDIAEDYWSSNRTLTLSDEDVQSRSSPAKSKINSSVSLSCSEPGNEYTLAGGTFYSAYDKDPLTITIGATANYLTLSVSLATIKSKTDPKYIDLANKMGEFMLNALYKGGGIFYSFIPVGGSGCPSGQYSDMNSSAVSDAAVSMQALSLLALSSDTDYSHLMDV
ncbi:hypothetical protein PQX77_006641 [Marasmius sp. AFHP31]|nr:hypothetical protein PQX77_006641 [Marasmius sp. AFHP31]